MLTAWEKGRIPLDEWNCKRGFKEAMVRPMVPKIRRIPESPCVSVMVRLR